MELNWQIPYIQVKGPIKINRYNLKNCQDAYWKNTLKGANIKVKYKYTKKNWYKTVSNLFRDCPHPDLASCGNQSVELR